MTRLARRLKDRLALQEPTQTPNASGGFTRSYSTLREMWGEVEDQGGREIIASKNAGEGNQVQITVRYDPDVKVKLFFLTIDENHPPRRFQIQSIKPMNHYEYLEIMAEEVEEEGS